MKVNSIKKNFVFYIFRMSSEMLIGLAIFPYVAKRLGAVGLGDISYVQAILSYFILFANLGIPSYGRREVAAKRENKQELTKFMSDIYSFSLILSIVVIGIYIITSFFSKNMGFNRSIYLIFSLQLIFNMFNNEWFYEGIENQEYITKRNVVIRLIYGLLVILLIKNPTHLYRYVLLTVLSNVFIGITNFINLKKHIYIKELFKFKFGVIRKYISPISTLFFASLMGSIVTQLDSIMVGKMGGSIAIGNYTFALKLGKIPQVFTTAIITVFFSRIINTISKGNFVEYSNLLKKSINLIFLLILPASIGMITLAPSIVLNLGGEDFRETINIMRVFGIYNIILSIAYVTGALILSSFKEDKILMKSMVIAASANFIFNFLMIPKYSGLGAAVGSILAELLAIIYRVISGKKYFDMYFQFDKNILKQIFSSLVMGTILLLSNSFYTITYFNLIIQILLGVFSYFVSLIVIRESTTKEVILKFAKKKRKSKT